VLTRPRDFDGLLGALPDLSRRFLELLATQRRIAMPRLLEELKLARAAAVQELLRPIRTMAGDYGLTDVYETATNDAGDRVFLWPGTPAEEAPTNVAPMPTGERRTTSRAGSETGSASVIPFEDRAQQVAPGLMRRRRRSG